LRNARIEAQIERFAPGFRARILVRHALEPRELEELNPNCVGGDNQRRRADAFHLGAPPLR